MLCDRRNQRGLYQLKFKCKFCYDWYIYNNRLWSLLYGGPRVAIKSENSNSKIDFQKFLNAKRKVDF